MAREQLDRALRQQGAEAERGVGSVPQLLHRARNRPGQSLAADLRRESEAVPASCHEFGIRFAPAGGRADQPVLEPAAFTVADPLQRGQHLTGEPARAFEHRVQQLGRERILLAHLPKALQADHMLEGEADLAEGRGEHQEPGVRSQDRTVA